MGAGDDQSERLQEFSGQLSACQAELLTYAFALVQNMADAEDVCQRAAVVLWQKYDQYEPGSEFRLWALKITQFEAFNFIRRRRGDRIFFHEDTLQAIVASQCEEASHVDQQAEWKLLRHCLANLTSQQRKLIQARYEGTQTLAQIADKLKRNHATVRSQLSRIRRMLRECVEGKMSEGQSG